MTSDGRATSLRDSLLDLLVYAPIGLALDAEELAPDLARRGRNHAAAARRIGEFAVLAGRRRIEQAIAQLADEPTAESDRLATEPGAPGRRTGSDEPPARVTANTEPAAGPDSEDDATPAEGPAAAPSTDGPAATPSADGLAIPEYDLLAASQVVKRLDALSPDQLEDVRVYEESTRGRRTILHKIARLQA